MRRGGGKGILIQDEHTGALRNFQQSVCYGISSYESNSMKSSNPYSGIYEAETTRTLDNNGGNPACNQGGMMVLQRGKQSYTLNTIDRPAVCFSVDEKMGNTYVHEEQGNTLSARDYKQPQAVCYGVDCYNQTASEEISKSLNSAATDSDHIPCVTYGLDRASFNQGKNAKYDFSVQEEIAQTIVSKGPGGVLTRQ